MQMLCLQNDTQQLKLQQSRESSLRNASGWPTKVLHSERFLYKQINSNFMSFKLFCHDFLINASRLIQVTLINIARSRKEFVKTCESFHLHDNSEPSRPRRRKSNHIIEEQFYSMKNNRFLCHQGKNTIRAYATHVPAFDQPEVPLVAPLW